MFVRTIELCTSETTITGISCTIATFEYADSDNCNYIEIVQAMDAYAKQNYKCWEWREKHYDCLFPFYICSLFPVYGDCLEIF